MKQLILFIFALFFSFNARIHAEVGEEAALKELKEAFLCPYVYNSVNVISGQYCEMQTDLKLNDSLHLRRMFNTNDPFSQGWVFNFPLFQNFEIKEKDLYTEKDETGRLTTIRSRDGKWMRFHYGTNQLKVTTSDDKWVAYTFEQSRAQFGDTLLINKIESWEGLATAYQYANHPHERKKLISKREIESGPYVLVEYYDEAEEGSRDPIRSSLCGKVKRLLAPVGDSAPVVTHTFIYNKASTEVYDAYDQKTVYRFGNNRLLKAIENYTKEGSLYRKEEYFWDRKNHLISKTLTGGAGNMLVSHSYTYDQNDNVASHTLFGNLTGTCQIPIFMQNGTPVQNGAESYTIRYQYDEDGNLIGFLEDSGYGKRFVYDEKNHLSASFTLDHGAIKIREFHTYNNAGKIIQTTRDDGTDTDPQSLSGVTKRLILKSSYFHDLPENIEEYAVDLSTGCEILLKITKNSYSENENLIRKEIFDADGNLVSSHLNQFDEKGNMIASRDLEGNLASISYDSNKNIVHAVSENKRIEKTYDQAGRETTHVEIDGDKKKATFYRLDYLGNKVESQDLFGNKTEHVYDSQNRLVKTIYPEVLDEIGQIIRPTVQFEHDLFDRIVKQTDARGYATKTEYNARGKPICITYPDGTHETFEYYLNGSLKKHKAANGLSTHYKRDFLGRTTEETTDNSTKKMVYTAFHLVEIHDDSSSTRILYDAAGRRTSVIQNEKKMEYSYDSMGRIESQREYYEKDQYAQVNFTQDLTGHVQKMELQDSQGVTLKETFLNEDEAPFHTRYIYDFFNERGQNTLRIDTTDQKGVVKETIFDAMGRPEKITTKDPFGQVIALKEILYDANGNVSTETHKAGERTFAIKKTYGPNNRLESIVEAFGKSCQRTTAYLYDSLGRLETIVQPNGVRLYHAYDTSSKLISLFADDGSVDYTYAYDNKGNLVHTKDNIHLSEITRSYNDAGLVTNESLRIKGHAFETESIYDNMGRLKGVVLPDSSSVHYTYDAAFLRKITRKDKNEQPIYCHTYTDYGKNGKLLSQELVCNAGTVTYQRNQKSFIEKIDSSHFFEKTTYDEHERIIRSETPNKLAHFAYDALDQVIEDTPHTYTYDLIGNRTSKDGKKHTIDDLNQLISDSEKGFLYDLNGNLIDDGENRYSYDALNRLVHVRTKCAEIEYTYDAFYRRLTETVHTDNGDGTKYFLYQEANEIGSMDKNGAINEFRVLGIGYGAEIGAACSIEIDQNIYACINDSRGNIACLVDARTKKAVEAYCYTAFGERKIYDACGKRLTHSKTRNPWGFSGKRFCEKTHLAAFGKRYYNPKTGRFITKDPLGFPDGPNAYAFVKNNPANLFDLYGLFSFSELWDSLAHFGKKCYEEFTEAVHTLQYHISFYDYIYPDLMKIGEATVGKGFLLLGGFYQDRSESGIHGKGELVDNVRITMINGILNSRQDYKFSLQTLSMSHGGMNIHYIFHATDGWAWDLFKGFLIKFGLTSKEARMLAKTWKELIEEMGGVNGGGTIYHYAHSIGAADTKMAQALLTPEEQKMIHVIAIGGATMLDDKGFASVTNYISFRDGVPFLDPIGFVRGVLGYDGINFVGSLRGIPFIDHPLSMSTYVELIEKLGLLFVRKHGL